MAPKFGLYAAAMALAAAAPTGAMAAQCGFDDVVTAYKVAYKDILDGKARTERNVMKILSEGGFPPAARDYAEDLASGDAGSKNRKAAGHWARLAALAGDATAATLSLRIGYSKETDSWKPRRLICDAKAEPRLADDPNARPEPRYELALAPGVPGKALATAKNELPRLFAAAAAENPMAAEYVALVKRILIVPGDRYDRYIGWKDGPDGGTLRISVGNFLDTGPKNAGVAIVNEIARRVYARLPDAKLDDPIVEIYEINGKKLKMQGSAYPDVSNVPFFRMVKRAYEMLQPVDPSLHKYADIVDEIRYNPPSHHFKRFGTLDVTAAYYNRMIGQDGRHTIFVRRKVTYLSPLFLARSIIHEGTHAAQQMRAIKYAHELPKLKRELAKLTAGGTGTSAEAKALKQKIIAEEGYAKAWYEGVKTETGRVQDIRFECEATINEIRAAREIDAQPSVMKDSGYIKLCPEAQKLMVAWQDEQLSGAKK